MQAGARHALIGPNGAGKTTLFNRDQRRVAAERRLDLPSFGTDVTTLAPHQRAALGISRTFQITRLFPEPHRDGERPAGVYGPGPASLRDVPTLVVAHRIHGPRAERLLDRFELSSLATSAGTAHLSYGDQRRLDVALSHGRPAAAAAAGRADGGTLVAGERGAMQRAHRRLDPAIAVLLIEHDMDMAFSFAERVTVLHQGRVLADGSRDEVGANEWCTDISGSGGRTLRVAVPGHSQACSKFSDVHTYYGDSHVLQGSRFPRRARPGTAVLGRNGVGKTTLCRSLTGLTPARRGRIVFDGVDITRLPLTESARRASASCRRDGASSSRSRSPRISHRRSREEIGQSMEYRPRVRAVSAPCRACHHGGERPERRRTADARDRARAGRKPALLVMDEPTEGLAPAVVAEVGRLIRQLRRTASRSCWSSRTRHSPWTWPTSPTSCTREPSFTRQRPKRSGRTKRSRRSTWACRGEVERPRSSSSTVLSVPTGDRKTALRARSRRTVWIYFATGAARLRELRRVDVGVRLHVGRSLRVTSVQPRIRPLERHLHACHLAIVRVVRLPRNTPDRRVVVAHVTHEQAGLGIEVERGRSAARR